MHTPRGVPTLTSERRLLSCPPPTKNKLNGVSCVSTSAFDMPSRYLPAWQHPFPSDEQAADAIERTLKETYGADAATRVVDDMQGARKHAAFQVQMANDDGETMQFLFLGEGRVAVRSESWIRGILDPPGCAKRGCINGPRSRSRMQTLLSDLGWLAGETDEDKLWVPLLLH